jgi:S1-C subfamily serine protease
VHTTSEGNRGTKVLQVKEGTAADAAGIKPDDVITEIDGDKIEGYESFERTLNQKAINGLVALTMERKEEVLQKNCIVDKYPVPY